jgi:broad-specificity NMP kinase
VFQIDICSVKDGRLQKKGYFRGTITENNEVERKYVVEFDDGEEREFGYDEEPLEKVIAGDNEYVKECKSTEDFMSKSHK